MKLPLILVLQICLLLLACTPKMNSSSEVGSRDSEGVIWDQDTRQEVTVQDADADLAQVTAVLFHQGRVKKEADGSYQIISRPLKSVYPICENEKFQDQSILGYCSGVLIGRHTLLTAGHCMHTEDFCTQSLISFGLTTEKFNSQKLNGNEIYRCKRIVKQVENAALDYAIVELDRDVTQTKPAKIGRGDDLQIGDKVTSMSYPLGLPLKKDTATVKENSFADYYLRARTDTFEGSSGSPLFNTRKELVGILVTGSNDFVDEEDAAAAAGKKKPAPKKAVPPCRQINRCTDTHCMGERYLKIENL